MSNFAGRFTHPLSLLALSLSLALAGCGSDAETPPVAQTGAPAVGGGTTTETTPVVTATPAPVVPVVATPVPPQATGSASLSWTAPTQNLDGSKLEDLAGYNIYHGSSAATMTTRVQVTNPSMTAYVIGDLEAGPHYFAMRAYNTDGIESEQSSIGNKTVM